MLRKAAVITSHALARAMLSILLALAALPRPHALAAPPPVLYVEAGGTGGCTSWADACGDLQQALAIAEPGTEIWVAQGTYVPGSDPSDTFTLRSGIALYGGFYGNETSRADRLWDTYLSTLSGDIGDPTIDDNVHHVVTGAGVDESAVLDGFRITRGNASQSGDGCGGGLLVSDASPTLANLWLTYNQALSDGAGACFVGSALSLDSVTFQLNLATASPGHGGGGLACLGCRVDLASCAFVNNVTGGEGGGLFVADGTASLAAASFTSNDAGGDGGAIYIRDSTASLASAYLQGNSANGSGGAIYAAGSSPGLADVSFVGNSATHGGAMYNDSGSSPTLTRVTFSGNSAAGGAGGAVYNRARSSPVFVDVSFLGNTAATGGALYNSDRSSPMLSNCIFSGNAAAPGAGGGIYNAGASNAAVHNCTFAYNAAAAGQSVYSDASTPVVANSILWGSASPQIDGAAASVSYSLVRGIAPGSGNVDADPLFVDADGTDGVPGSADDNLRLRAGSPALDAGSNGLIAADSADLDGDLDRAEATPLDAGGNARRRDVPAWPDTGAGSGPIVDLGAFERSHVHHLRAGWAAGNHSGTSWVDAFASLDDAVAAAGAGDEVWVAAGNYVPAVRTDASDSRSATFTMASGVALYGGFAGTETAREQRDWQAHAAVLSGDVGGNDAGFTNTGENCYHVVTTGGVDTTAVLDGFTIRGGNANLEVSPWDRMRGAGIYNLGGSPTLAHLVITGNSAGTAANPGYGGGMYSDGAGAPSLRHVTFAGNRARYGAGMANLNGSDATVEDAVFSGNTGQLGGGSSLSGAGAGMYSALSDPIVRRTTFTGNAATLGGAMVNAGSSPLLVWVDFTRNAGGNGGAMYNGWYSPSESNPVVVSSVFRGNTASGSGGATYSEAGTNPVFVNTVFSGNVTTGSGGAVWSMGTLGGTTSTTVLSSTFSGNQSGACGGGIFSYYYSDPAVTNSVLWGNTAGEGSAQICIGQLAAVSVAYSLVQGSYAGNGNVDADPAFMRSPFAGADGAWGTTDDDYGDLRLQTGSPAIDAGSNAAVAADDTDLDADGDSAEPLPFDATGDPDARFVNHRRPDTGEGATPVVDVGAYESQDANHAPVLDGSGSPYLSAVTENATDPAGDTVAAIVDRGAGGDPISDVDTGSPEGVAVVAVDDTHGTWQYRIGGGPWVAFGPVSPASAVALALGDDRIRFVPAATFVGTVDAGLAFVAWDQSDGLAGGTAGVRVDPGGGSTPWSAAAETVSIAVTNVNDPPTGLSLTSSSVPEHRPMGTDVGVLQTADPDAGDVHSYWLVPGPGSDDNGLFALYGDHLRTVVPFDFEVVSSYTIRARTTDAGGLWHEASFTVSVTAVDEAPQAAADAYTALQNTDLLVAGPGLLANDTDPEGQALGALLVGAPAHGTVTVQADGSFVYAPESGFSGSDGFSYRASDGAVTSAETSVTIAVAPGGPVASLSAEGVEVDEGGGQGTLTIGLNQASVRVVTVHYNTVAASAAAGSDFAQIAGTLVLQPGETSGTVSIAIVDDATHEGTETFAVELSGAVNAVVGAPESATVTIADDDAAEAPQSVICLPLLLHRR